MKNRFGYSLNVLLSEERVDCFHYFSLYPAPYVIKANIKPWIHRHNTKLKYQQKKVFFSVWLRIKIKCYLECIEVHLVDLSYHIRHGWNHRCQTRPLFHLIHDQEMNYWRKLVGSMKFQLCYATPYDLLEIIPAFWLLTSQC